MSIINDTDKVTRLTEDDTLIFSTIEGLNKFGFEIVGDDSYIKEHFSKGLKARTNIHYSCACPEDNWTCIAHIRRIDGFITPEEEVINEVLKTEYEYAKDFDTLEDHLDNFDVVQLYTYIKLNGFTHKETINLVKEVFEKIELYRNINKLNK